MNDIFENVWNILWYESFKNKIYLIMERIFDNMYLMNCSASSACTQRCAAAAKKKVALHGDSKLANFVATLSLYYIAECKLVVITSHPCRTIMYPIVGFG